MAVAFCLLSFTSRLHGVKFHQLCKYTTFIVDIDQALAWRLVWFIACAAIYLALAWGLVSQ